LKQSITWSYFPVELAIHPATTDQGEIFIAFLRDISQRVAAEAELSPRATRRWLVSSRQISCRR
jgi:hypothetical protein